MTRTVAKAVPADSQRASGAGRFHAILRRGQAWWLELVVGWNKGRRDRQLLAALNEWNLRDIGIDSVTVGRDSAAAFWRVRYGLDMGSAVEKRHVGRSGGEDIAP